MQSSDRFECLRDDEAWMIWDIRNDRPAEFGDFILIGLTETTAHELADILNGRSSVADRKVVDLHAWRSQSR